MRRHPAIAVQIPCRKLIQSSCLDKEYDYLLPTRGKRVFLSQEAQGLDLTTITDYISNIGIADERLTHVLLAITALLSAFDHGCTGTGG